MEIEKYKNSAVMPYQGSAASAAVSSAGTAEKQAASIKQAENFQLTEPVKQAGDTSQAEKGDADKKRIDDSQTNQNAQLKNAVNDFNRQVSNSEAIFGIHEKTNRVTIKIVDKTTKEVLKEYPPEETLDMIAKVWEVAGILVDEKR